MVVLSIILLLFVVIAGALLIGATQFFICNYCPYKDECETCHKNGCPPPCRQNNDNNLNFSV